MQISLHIIKRDRRFLSGNSYRVNITFNERANEVVRQLSDAIENYEKVAAKATAAGNAKKAAEALESAAARRVWLAEAEKGLAEFN